MIQKIKSKTIEYREKIDGLHEETAEVIKKMRSPTQVVFLPLQFSWIDDAHLNKKIDNETARIGLDMLCQLGWSADSA